MCDHFTGFPVIPGPSHDAWFLQTVHVLVLFASVCRLVLRSVWLRRRRLVTCCGAWQRTCSWQRDPKGWAPLPPVRSRPRLPSARPEFKMFFRLVSVVLSLRPQLPRTPLRWQRWPGPARRRRISSQASSGWGPLPQGIKTYAERGKN